MTWSLNIDLTGVDGYDGVSSIDVGEEAADELFVDAFDRAFAKANGGKYGTSLQNYRDHSDELIFTLENEEGEDGVPVTTGPTLTVAEMRAFVGERPTTLRVAWGVGGDETSIVETIWTLATLGLTYLSLQQAMGMGGAAVDRLIYRADHQSFQDWADGGPLTMPLEQAARSQPDWTLTETRRRFGASEERASAFFLALGYEPRRDEWGQRHWVDPDTIS